MNNITEEDLVGTEFFRFSDLKSLDKDSYLKCLKFIKPLFENPDFKSLTSGFYINYIPNEARDGGGYSVRLKYFTKDWEKVKKVTEKFSNTNGIVEIFPSQETKTRPTPGPISLKYGGEELRFRRFLTTYPHIGLDLLDYDILYSRRLVAEYRFTYSAQRISCRPLFEPAFSKYSEFFRRLDNYSAEQLWEDLDYGDFQGIYTHFLVNMLLPADIIVSGLVRTEEGKRRILREHSYNFDIPDDWSP